MGFAFIGSTHIIMQDSLIARVGLTTANPGVRNLVPPSIGAHTLAAPIADPRFGPIEILRSIGRVSVHKLINGHW